VISESRSRAGEEQRLGVHQSDARELSGGTAFDQIAGDRERRPGESMSGVFVASNSFTTRSTVWARERCRRRSDREASLSPRCS